MMNSILELSRIVVFEIEVYPGRNAAVAQYGLLRIQHLSAALDDNVICFCVCNFLI